MPVEGTHAIIEVEMPANVKQGDILALITQVNPVAEKSTPTARAQLGQRALTSDLRPTLRAAPDAALHGA